MAITDLITSSYNPLATKIPEGKRITLTVRKSGSTKYETLLPSIDLALSEDLILNVNSSFVPLLNRNQGTWESLISAASGGLVDVGKISDLAGSGTQLAGKFKEQGISIWQSTSPLSFSLNIALYMKTNGREDVVTPAYELMKVVVPKETKEGFLLPPGPSALFTISKALGRGANVVSGAETDLDSLKGFIEKHSTFQEYQIKIGNYFYVDNLLITRAEPIFSNDVDNEGNPIWAKVRLDCQTTNVCTKEMIDNFIKMANMSDVAVIKKTTGQIR